MSFPPNAAPMRKWKKKKKTVAAHHVINTALSQGSRIATGYIWERRNLRPPKVFKNTVLKKKKKKFQR